MAFNPVQFQPSNRGYVQTNVVRQPQANVNAGFAQFGRGIGDLAYGVGALGEVVNNWGANKRAMNDARNNALLDKLQYVSSDSVQSILGNPEELAAQAAAEDMDVDRYSAFLRQRLSMQTPESINTQTYDMLTRDPQEGQHFDDPAMQAAYEQEQAQAEAPQEQAVEGEVSVEGGAEAPMTEEGPAGPQEANPEELSAMLQEQQMAQDLIVDAATRPTTADMLDQELAALKEFQPAAVSPEVEAAAQKKVTHALQQDTLFKKRVNLLMAQQMASGQPVNPDLASEVAALMGQPVEATREAIRSYGYMKFKHIPFEYKKYFDDQEYFNAHVDLRRAMTDIKFRDEVLGPDGVKELQDFVRGTPQLWMTTYGPAVDATALAQMQQGVVERNTVVAERGQTLNEKAEENRANESLMTLGMEQQKINELRTQNAWSRGFSDKEFSMKLQEMGQRHIMANKEYKLREVGARVGILQARAEALSKPYTDANLAYKTFSDLSKVPGQSLLAKQWLNLDNDMTNLAVQEQKLSQAYHAAGEGLEGAKKQQEITLKLEEIEAVRRSIDARKADLEKRAGSAGIELLTGRDSVTIKIDEDRAVVRQRILDAMGFSSRAHVDAARDIDDLHNGVFGTQGLGQAYVVPKLQNAAKALQNRGQLMPTFTTIEDFAAFAARGNIRPGETELRASFEWWNNKARQQRALIEDSANYRAVEGNI